MIATRHGETELSHPWSFNKLETSYPRRPSPIPRMSNAGYETPLSSASEWQGQYSFLPPAEPIFATSAYGHVGSSGDRTSIGTSVSTTISSNSGGSGYGNSTSNGAVGGLQSQDPARPSADTNRDNDALDDLGSKMEAGSPSSLHHRRSVDPLDHRQHSQPRQQPQSQPQQQQTPHLQRPSTPAAVTRTTTPSIPGATDQHSANVYVQKIDSLTENDSSSLAAPSSTNSLSLGPSSIALNPLGSVASILQIPGPIPGHGNGSMGGTSENHPGLKEEEEDLLDDEGLGDGGDADAVPPAQTVAERTAQRRKMKRFRLTHQQTRFLMSEFAKQPHPDAAHRERLSREIPGLSPRQVQVWFQNRRAKIKRLAADDRERMVKMRAVPDDFDNVQALHSPYGAVHGLGTPLASPVDFGGAPSYADHIMRPLMVDVRRPDDSHLSPTGLSPAFGSIGFTPSAPSILSPLSPTPNDHRYGSYPNHLAAAAAAAAVTSASSAASPISPLGGTSPRAPNPYARQNSLDSATLSITSGSTGPHHHQRHQIRPLQPLQLRDAMSRSRSDNLQSPLRSSMSWKGDSLDYTSYHHAGSSSPQLGSRHPQSLYQPEGLGAGTSTAMSPYSGSTVQSPTHLGYQGFQSPGLPPNSQNRSSGLHAASATLPLDLDLRSPSTSGGSSIRGLRSMSMSSKTPPPSTRSTSNTTPQLGVLGLGEGSGSGPSLTGLASHSPSSASSYTSGFASSTPLTTPLDFRFPRTPYRTTSGNGNSDIGVSSSSDYSLPQLAAPLTQSNDFAQTFHGMAAATPFASATTSISAALNSHRPL